MNMEVLLKADMVFLTLLHKQHSLTLMSDRRDQSKFRERTQLRTNLLTTHKHALLLLHALRFFLLQPTPPSYSSRRAAHKLHVSLFFLPAIGTTRTQDSVRGANENAGEKANVVLTTRKQHQLAKMRLNI